MAVHFLAHSSPDRLLDLLRQGTLASEESCGWGPSDYAGIWRHLVRVPLVTIFHEPDRSADLSEVISIWDLLTESCPSFGTVRLVAQYAKSHVAHEQEDLPQEIARVLYFMMVWVGRRRCRRQDISTLPDAKLREGLLWSVDRDWLDAPTRALITAMIDSTS